MLTALLIALASGGCFVAFQERRRRYFVEYMRNKLPSADTDEDVIGVLEASGAEIAPKLLLAAEGLDQQADWRHDAYAQTPDLVAWEYLLKDLAMEKTDEDRLPVLHNWLERGFNVTVTESVMIVGHFETPAARATARALITQSMQEKAA